MKHILALLAGCCISTTVANAQVNVDGLHEFTRQRIAQPEKPVPMDWMTKEWMSKYPPPAPAIKGASLPPVEFDHEYKGQLVVTKFDDYSLIRMICKDTPTALACSYRTYNSQTGAPISCLILLGPKVHDDERALRHEIGHCNGWSGNHEGAR